MARLKDSPAPTMDPPSPSKFFMSPGMPLFPVSPERVAGTKPPYGAPVPQSPSLPDLSTSPFRGHRRDDSTVCSLASMFENLAVKDPKEAHAKYVQALEKQKSRHASDMKEMQRKHEQAMQRLEARNEELKASVSTAQKTKDAIPRDQWDKRCQEHRDAIAKWVDAMKLVQDRVKQAEKKAHELSHENKMLLTKAQQYKKKNMELSKDALRSSSYVPTLQAKIQSLERNARTTESDLKFQTGEASKYKNMVYGLQVDLESVEARLNDEVQTLKDRLRLVEGERDALKTSLKEEEVLRIAAEGQIPLPAATNDEHDAFAEAFAMASPVRSPRRLRTPDRDENKENVSPKKVTVELRLVQSELAAEKRLRERAQDQIDFMKMECQFRCCSCRIADLKGSSYVHDDSYDTEMELIKASMPEITPPPSAHEDESMEGVVIKEESMEDVDIKEEPADEEVPLDMIPMESEASELPSDTSEEANQDGVEPKFELSAFPLPPASPAPDADIAFSPTTGTFRAVPSPAKAPVSMHTATPAKASVLGLSTMKETSSSPWTPDANSTVIHHDNVSPLQLHPAHKREPRQEPELPQRTKSGTIAIHEDSAMQDDDDDDDDDDDENTAPQSPLSGPSGPATPGPYLMRTITTTTTIPLHFSPMTPAVKNYTMTPSTVAHAPTNAQSHVLGDLSLNSVPFDRQAALEAIRQRRGRARSMAAGHGTPGKLMMEGVKERRDISAPVERVRR